MTDQAYPVVKSFRLRTAEEDDYLAYQYIDPSEAQPRTSEKAFADAFLKNMGYNPGSSKGNRQECVVCGKSGSECIGHPLVLDMESMGVVFASEFSISTITALTSVICVNCKSVVRDKLGTATALAELLKISNNRYACNCGPNSKPVVEPVKEEAIPDSEKQFEWRDGRKRQKKRSYLHLSKPPRDVRDLLQATDLSPLHINKEYVLGLFFTKMILLPTSVQPMNFRRSQSAGVEEKTKMIDKYAELAVRIKNGDTESVAILQRALSVGVSSDKFSGTPSHLMVCDQKTGLFRGPGQNKRAKETARAVATPNIYGRSSELMCPEFIMRNLQNIYTVSVHNKEWLQSEAGESVTHLVTTLGTSTTNSRELYKKISKQTVLKLGDKVLKELRDGDYAIMFRNPTLWRHSLIGYRVKVWKNYCMGAHETNAAGHNLDFDGDELNLMVGANLASRIEMQMMDAAYQLFSGRSGEPIIGIAYNGIVGAFVLSTDDSIDGATFAKLKNIIEARDTHEETSRIRELVVDEAHYQKLAQKHGVPYHSGRTLISMLLPRQLNYKRGDVEIEGGFMLRGKLRAADVSRGLITAISAIDPWRAPYLFVDRGYTMMSAYISTRGLTISAEDYVMPGEKRKHIIPAGYQEALLQTESEIAELERSKSQKTKASIQRIEERISHKLGKLTKMVSQLLEKGEYSRTNGATIAYMSGARGNVGNIAATVTNVGQMYSGNERYDSTVSRSSYYVPRDSVSIFDRGFVRSSYAQGLTPAEVMVAANAARRQALNVYLGTPISGQTAKQTTLHQADVRVSDALSVVDGNGRILDCIYGYGCDSTMITYRKLPMGEVELPVDPIALLERINAE